MPIDTLTDVTLSDEPWVCCYCLSPSDTAPIYCERFSEESSKWVIRSDNPLKLIAEDGYWEPSGAFLARNGDRRARPMQFESPQSALAFLKRKTPTSHVHNAS